jgi:hypothetical protein
MPNCSKCNNIVNISERDLIVPLFNVPLRGPITVDLRDHIPVLRGFNKAEIRVCPKCGYVEVFAKK